jgi:serine/threonine protein kinase
MPSPLPASQFHEIASLGVGGMGGVNLAVSIGPAGFTKLLVVKRLRPEIADVPEFLSMFLQEAKLSARLNHPNIVQTYEISADATSHFLMMEYLEGQSLQAFLRASRQGPAAQPGSFSPNGGPPSSRGGAYPIRDELAGGRRPTLPYCLRAITDALEGLHYAHELCDHDGMPLNIVHRDVSPGNIFITYDGTVKLLDFGIAKASDSTQETRAGMLKGKIAFMAPEQLRQGTAIDRRVDIFAVGVMLWEAATGRKLWRGVPDLEVLMRLSKGQIPRPSEAAPGVHPKLEAICNKAMAFDPADRYATAADLRDDLEGLLDEMSPVSSRALGAYVAELFAVPRAEARAFVRRRLDELRSVHAVDEPTPSARPSRPNDPLPEDSRMGPMPHTISRPVRREEVPRGERGPVAWVALTAVGALVVAVAALWARGRAPASAAPSAAVAPAHEPPRAAPTVSRLTVTASPAEARLFVDGALASANPYAATVPLDGKKHEVRAEAPGFVPQTKVVEFGPGGAALHFALEREGPDAPAGEPRGPAPEAPAPLVHRADEAPAPRPSRGRSARAVGPSGGQAARLRPALRRARPSARRASAARAACAGAWSRGSRASSGWGARARAGGSRR